MIQFDNKICHVTFSHSSYKDLWPVYFGETKKLFDNNMTHFLCVDQIIEEIPEGIVPIVYDQSESYPHRLTYCLQALEQYEFIFFDHEDMFLYGKPDEKILLEYYQVMKEGRLDHIRLIKGGSCLSKPFDDIPSLHLLSLRSKWIFSIQPSFWKRDKLIEVLSKNLDCNIWELEGKSQEVVKNIKLRAAYSYQKGGVKRGFFHFDNLIYPYIATAIGKGRWNYKEYKTELSKVFLKYRIDPAIRGESDETNLITLLKRIVKRTLKPKNSLL